MATLIGRTLEAIAEKLSRQVTLSKMMNDGLLQRDVEMIADIKALREAAAILNGDNVATKPITGVKLKPGADGKVKVEKSAPKGQSVSAKIRQRKSKKQRAVSPAKAGRVK